MERDPHQRPDALVPLEPSVSDGIAALLRERDVALTRSRAQEFRSRLIATVNKVLSDKKYASGIGMESIAWDGQTMNVDDGVRTTKKMMDDIALGTSLLREKRAETILARLARGEIETLLAVGSQIRDQHVTGISHELEDRNELVFGMRNVKSKEAFIIPLSGVVALLLSNRRVRKGRVERPVPRIEKGLRHMVDVRTEVENLRNARTLLDELTKLGVTEQAVRGAYSDYDGCLLRLLGGSQTSIQFGLGELHLFWRAFSRRHGLALQKPFEAPAELLPAYRKLFAWNKEHKKWMMDPEETQHIWRGHCDEFPENDLLNTSFDLSLRFMGYARNDQSYSYVHHDKETLWTSIAPERTFMNSGVLREFAKHAPEFKIDGYAQLKELRMPDNAPILTHSLDAILAADDDALRQLCRQHPNGLEWRDFVTDLLPEHIGQLAARLFRVGDNVARSLASQILLLALSAQKNVGINASIQMFEGETKKYPPALRKMCRPLTDGMLTYAYEFWELLGTEMAHAEAFSILIREMSEGKNVPPVFCPEAWHPEFCKGRELLHENLAQMLPLSHPSHWPKMIDYAVHRGILSSVDSWSSFFLWMETYTMGDDIRRVAMPRVPDDMRPTVAGILLAHRVSEHRVRKLLLKDNDVIKQAENFAIADIMAKSGRVYVIDEGLLPENAREILGLLEKDDRAKLDALFRANRNKKAADMFPEFYSSIDIESLRVLREEDEGPKRRWQEATEKFKQRCEDAEMKMLDSDSELGGYTPS